MEINDIYVPKPPLNVNYRKRDQVSKLRKLIETFEFKKREYIRNSDCLTFSVDDFEESLNAINKLSVEIARMRSECYDWLHHFNSDVFKNTYRTNLKESLTLLRKMGAVINYDSNEHLIIDLMTENVCIPHNGKTINIGRFRVSLTISVYGDLGIFVENTTKKLEDQYDHPHINNGAVCVGGYSDRFNYLSKNGLIYDCYMLLLDILHEYNPLSPFKKIEYWDDSNRLMYCAECGNYSGDCTCENASIPEEV